jgi:hypothetical protein
LHCTLRHPGLRDARFGISAETLTGQSGRSNFN